MLSHNYIENTIARDKWDLITHNQHHFLVDTLFLCLGHAPNNQFSHLNTSPNFFPRH